MTAKLSKTNNFRTAPVSLPVTPSTPIDMLAFPSFSGGAKTAPVYTPQPPPTASTPTVNAPGKPKTFQAQEAELPSDIMEPGTLLMRRYRILELLGEGGMGCVYRVWDQEARVERALKMLTSYGPSHSAAELDTLSKEFLALRRFRHPNIVAVYDLGYTEEQVAYFTMDFVDGETLNSYICHPNREWLQSLCREIMLALAAVHGQGMLHADLKPANILIDTNEGHPRARLADFGLTATIQEFSTEHIRGTVPYLAPERILRQPPNIHSDLYALGVLLYHLFTGELPFGEEPAQTVLKRHLYTKPVPPSQLEPSISPQHEEIILRLLEKDPSMRYRSVDEVMEAWEEHSNILTENAQHVAFYCNESIGRGQETKLFQQKYNRLPEQGNWMFLTGDMGVGKTHLLNHWRIETQLQQGHWLQYSPQTDLPFSPLRELCEALAVRQPESHPMRQIANLLQGNVLLYDAELGYSTSSEGISLHALESAKQTSPEEARQTLFQQLTTLFQQLDFSTPVVLVIDQMERLGEDTYSLLQHLSIHCSNAPLLWVLSGRTATQDWLTPLQDAVGENASHIALDALKYEHIQRLLQRMLGEVTGLDALTQSLMAQSSGNPLLVVELLWEFQRNGSLHRAHGSWWFDSVVARRSGASSQQTLNKLLLQKFASCSEQEQLLLSLMALWMGPIQQERLQQLSVMTIPGEEQPQPLVPNRDQFLKAVVGLQRRGLCNAQHDGENVWLSLIPPHLESLLVEQFSTSQLKGWHHRIFAVLQWSCERGEKISAASLIRHALASEHWTVVQQLLDAAQQEFVSTRAYAQGLKFFRELSKQLSHRKESLRVGNAHLAAAKFARHLSQFEELRHQLNAALSVLQNAPDRQESQTTNRCETASEKSAKARPESFGNSNTEAERCSLLAEIHHNLGRDDNRLGQYDEALEHFRKAHRWLEKRPKLDEESNTSSLKASLWRGMGWGYMMQGQYEEAQRMCVRALEAVSAEQDYILCCQIHRLHAAIAFYQGQPEIVQREAQLALALAEQHFDLRGQAEAYFTFGNLANLQGQYHDAVHHFKLAYQYFEQIDLLEAMGRCRNNLGVASYLQGNWEQAIHHWEQFATICKRRNDRSQLVNALNNFAFLYKDRGLFQQAKKTLQQALKIAQVDGLERLEATLQGNLGETLWRMAELEQATFHIRQAIQLSQKLGAGHEVVENQRRLIAMDLSNGELEQAESGIHRLLEQLESNPIPQEEAHLLLLRGHLSLKRNKTQSAYDDLQQAAQQFHGLKATFEEARCWALIAQTCQRQGNLTTAVDFANRAKERFKSLGAQWDLEQINQYFPQVRHARKRTNQSV